MKISKKFIYTVVIFLVINQVNAQYEIKEFTINNGGGKITGGSYELNASIGQTDASTNLSNGDYLLVGGFWHENQDLIFKNTFE